MQTERDAGSSSSSDRAVKSLIALRQSRKLQRKSLAASFAAPTLQSELVFTLPGPVSAVSAVKPNLICRCARQRGVSRPPTIQLADSQSLCSRCYAV